MNQLWKLTFYWMRCLQVDWMVLIQEQTAAQRNFKLPNFFMQFGPMVSPVQTERRRTARIGSERRRQLFVIRAAGTGGWRWTLSLVSNNNCLSCLHTSVSWQAISHCDCCLDTDTYVADTLRLRQCSDSPAAWSGLSAVCCRGCISVWLVCPPLGLYDAGCWCAERKTEKHKRVRETSRVTLKVSVCHPTVEIVTLE